MIGSLSMNYESITGWVSNLNITAFVFCLPAMMAARGVELAGSCMANFTC